jgi:hypothetical protein
MDKYDKLFCIAAFVAIITICISMLGGVVGWFISLFRG